MKSDLEWNSMLNKREDSNPGGLYRNVFVVVLLLALGYLAHDFVWPLLLAAVFAVVLTPAYEKIKRKWPHPAAASTLLTLGFTLAFLLPFGLIVFLSVKTAIEQLGKFSNSDSAGVGPMLEYLQNSSFFRALTAFMPGAFDDVESMFSKLLQSVGAGAMDVFKKFMEQIPEIIVAATVMVVALYVFLRHGSAMVSFLRRHSPFTQSNTDKIFESIRVGCESAIFASVMTGLIQTVIITTGALLAGVPGILLVVVASFLGSFVPVVGTAPVTVVIAGYFLAGGHWTNFIIMAAAGVLAGVSDNFARPLFIEGKTHIHPLAAFVFTFGALGTIGVYGIFLGPVAAGLFFSLMALSDRILNERMTAEGGSK